MQLRTVMPLTLHHSLLPSQQHQQHSGMATSSDRRSLSIASVISHVVTGTAAHSLSTLMAMPQWKMFELQFRTMGLPNAPKLAGACPNAPCVNRSARGAHSPQTSFEILRNVRAPSGCGAVHRS